MDHPWADLEIWQKLPVKFLINTLPLYIVKYALLRIVVSHTSRSASVIPNRD